jgi:phosphoglycerate dehydrogenase-like enzyme
MTRIQLTEPAFERLRPRLDALAQPLEYVLMDEAGVLRFDGRAISPEEARPECGFLSNDLFFASPRLQAAYIGALVQSPALRWVQSCGAGLDHSMFTMLAQRRDIRLSTNHSQAIGIAEYVMWGILDHFHTGAAQPTLSDEAGGERWVRRRAREIHDSHWLILGFGSIGQAVACRARAFGAHVTGVRRSPGPAEFADAIVAPDRIFDALPDADVVVLSMPQTPETVNLVDDAFLEAMKPTSVLVNVGRGSAIDDEALLRSLAAGSPGHAQLDVFRVEPLPDDHPFWSHPRITATAHTAAVSTGWDRRLDELVVDNLRRYLSGQPLRNEIPISEVPRRSDAS